MTNRNNPSLVGNDGLGWAGLCTLRRCTVGVNGSHAFSMIVNRTFDPTIRFWVSVQLLVAATALDARTVRN